MGLSKYKYDSRRSPDETNHFVSCLYVCVLYLRGRIKKKPLVWDGDKIAEEYNRKYTGYEKYLNRPIGTATLIRNGKVLEKKPFSSLGYTAGDTVRLSKGLHLVDLSKRITENSEDVRLGDVVYEGKARGKITIEGEGADTIIIDVASIKEKRPPKAIRFALESSENVRFEGG